MRGAGEMRPAFMSWWTYWRDLPIFAANCLTVSIKSLIRVARTDVNDMRLAARTDGNQALIVAALRRIGCQVYYIKEPLDLLVGFRGRNILLECKMLGENLNAGQQEFCNRWNGEWHVVHNETEALTAIVGKEAMR